MRVLTWVCHFVVRHPERLPQGSDPERAELAVERDCHCERDGESIARIAIAEERALRRALDLHPRPAVTGVCAEATRHAVARRVRGVPPQ